MLAILTLVTLHIFILIRLWKMMYIKTITKYKGTQFNLHKIWVYKNHSIENWTSHKHHITWSVSYINHCKKIEGIRNHFLFYFAYKFMYITIMNHLYYFFGLPPEHTSYSYKRKKKRKKKKNYSPFPMNLKDTKTNCVAQNHHPCHFGDRLKGVFSHFTFKIFYAARDSGVACLSSRSFVSTPSIWTYTSSLGTFPLIWKTTIYDSSTWILQLKQYLPINL